jgi:membrane associated rhomboid family serine protease
MSAHEHIHDDVQPRRWPAILHPVVLVALMWAIEFLDRILPGQWERFGLRGWDFSSLGGIVLAPLLHTDWAHLAGNSVPFVVLGALVAIEGARRYWLVTALIALVGAIGPLLLTAPGTLTVGASGLVFGYFAYVVVPGVRHRLLFGAIAVIVAIAYGGVMFAGIFAAGAGVSWQGHLTGAIGGIVAALVLRERD